MYTVVVADDEEELRRALIRRVDWEAAGFRVVGEAENGAEALELVEKLEPDLLLTDIQMPFITGIELARQVREIRPTMQIAFLSGYDEFSYAQQAIQYNIISYILKPVSSAELTEELKRIKDKIDAKFREFVDKSSAGGDWVEISEFLMPLLLDEFQGELTEEKNQKLLQTAKACGLIQELDGEHKFAVMVTSIFDENGKNATTRANVNAIDIILRKYIKHASIYVEGRVVSLLTATQMGFEKYLHIAVEDIVQSVKRIMDKQASVGVSRVVEQIGAGHEAYVGAVSAAEYSLQTDDNIHFISDVERSDEIDQEMYMKLIAEIENLIRSGSRQELEEYLNFVFDQIEAERYSPATVGFVMMQLVSAVFRIAYSTVDKDYIQELQICSPMQGLFISGGLEELRDKNMRFCLKAKELISEQRKKSSSVLCDQAMSIIETRYFEPELSLAVISNEIAVSPNYLSAIIKKSTGTTFVDLLTGKRIETAKQLLLDSNMKIREIAEKCGYSDQHYFSYCFRKYTGASPNSHRSISKQSLEAE